MMHSLNLSVQTLQTTKKAPPAPILLNNQNIYFYDRQRKHINKVKNKTDAHGGYTSHYYQ
jgi:hypothetical protein